MLLCFLLSDQGSGHTCSDNICEHNCTDLTEGGLLCSCRSGYKPRATERHTCEGKTHTRYIKTQTKNHSSTFNKHFFFLLLQKDVNECEVYSTCPQECRNTKGSYECFCAEGFLSFGEPHGTECAAQGKSSAFTHSRKLFTTVPFH